tara:strand:- start:74 stop:208 length:135 start_codon:yes stop_codon:yes gene_type:complete
MPMAGYFYYGIKSLNFSYIFGVVAAIFILATIFEDHLLLPFNKL